MREIKFRAWLHEWDVDMPIKGKMFYDCLPLGGWNGWWLNLDGKPYDGEWKNDGKELTIMQYTGLKDKNGKEIYEGDIIHHAAGEVGAVEWQGQGWTIQPQMRANPGGFFCGKWSLYTEIVGNIYENPELLQPEEATTALGQHDEDEEGQIDEMRLNNDL